MVNVPAGTTLGVIPIEFSVSTATPNFCAHASWYSFSFAASNGALAGGGEVLGATVWLHSADVF